MNPAALAEVRRRYRDATPARRRDIHVDAGADPARAASGSAVAPHRSIQTALDAARPGDRVLIHPGRYGPLDLYGRAGEPDAWISVEAADAPGSVVVDARAAGRDGVDVQQSRCVSLFGLRVEGDRHGGNPDASGIAVFRGSAHVRVWCCAVTDFPGGGINCFWTGETVWQGQRLPAGGWDAVDLAFDRVEGCCRYSAWNTSGISFFGAEELGAPLPGGWGYRAVGNVVRDCVCLVPYAPGGVDVVTDGNGISVDSLLVRNALTPGLAPYRRPGLVEGNLLAGNGGRGLHVFESADVLAVRNTAVGDLWSDSPAFAGAAELDWTGTAAELRGVPPVRLIGNVVLPSPERRAIGPGVRCQNVVLGGAEAPSAADVDRRDAGATYFDGRDGGSGAGDDARWRPRRGDPAEDPDGVLGASVEGFLGAGGAHSGAGALRTSQ